MSISGCRHIRLFAMLLALAGCAVACKTPGNRYPANVSISNTLRKGMNQHDVAALSSSRVPDRIVETECGTRIPRRFECKAYVFEGSLQGGRYDPKLTILFEKSGGEWLVGHGTDVRAFAAADERSRPAR